MTGSVFTGNKNTNKEKYIKESSLSKKRYEDAESRYKGLWTKSSRIPLERESIVRQYYLPKRDGKEGASSEGECQIEGKSETEAVSEKGREQKKVQIDEILGEGYEGEILEPSEEKTWFSKISRAILAGIVLGIGTFALTLLWPEEIRGFLEAIGLHWLIRL